MMNQKLNLLLFFLSGAGMAMGGLILISPLDSQKTINTWFENSGSDKTNLSNQAPPNLKVTGPASSGSNFSQ